MVNCIVIDDDQDIVDVFCEILKVINVDILATGNDGKDAVNLYEKHKPDIVFTDLQMPQYDGIYAVENIKDLNLDAKLVVITGDHSAGADIFDILRVPVINKPFNTHEIKQIINDVFLVEDNSILPFEIQYKFENDMNVYSCTVTYAQYRNFKQIPIVQDCTIVNTQKNVQLHRDEMQKALDLVVDNDTSHIRELSEIVRN